jgi:hypothetical protein
MAGSDAVEKRALKMSWYVQRVLDRYNLDRRSTIYLCSEGFTCTLSRES